MGDFMENKNNVVVILLVVLIGAVSAVGLLIGINNAVGAALSPLSARLAIISKTEKSIENKLNELAQIQNRFNTNVPNVPQPPQPQQPPPEDMNMVYAIDPGVSSIIGKKDAPVTIVEFSDFQCPFCARFYPTVKDVLAAYPNQVRLIIKNYPLPFHPNARPAAKLAMAANEQGKFQGMMETLLGNDADVSDAKIKDYAKNLGLDYNKLMADYKNKDAQWEKQIQEDMLLGGSVDVRGTPTFYLNGRKTSARDVKSFKAQIDAILAGQK
jgi:protein-disulfide isomerase